jgi:site-specific recombinase XerD
LKEALRLDLLDPIDYAKAVDIGTVKGNRCPKGRALSKVEISALMAGINARARPSDLWDAALIAILRGAGFRRSEAVNLELKDFNASELSLLVRGGKGAKDRMVYLSHVAAAMVERWLALRGFTPGALLNPIRKNGRIELRAMSDDAVLRILDRRAESLGIESFSPHDLRRTFCSDLLDAGVDLVTVQKLAGHESPATTARYDRRGEEMKKKAVEKLDF